MSKSIDRSLRRGGDDNVSKISSPSWNRWRCVRSVLNLSITTLTASRCSQVLNAASPRNVDELLPDPDEDILCELVGVASGSHPPHEAVHLRQVRAIELLERADISRRGGSHVIVRIGAATGGPVVLLGPQR